MDVAADGMGAFFVQFGRVEEVTALRSGAGIATGGPSNLLLEMWCFGTHVKGQAVTRPSEALAAAAATETTGVREWSLGGGEKEGAEVSKPITSEATTA